MSRGRLGLPLALLALGLLPWVVAVYPSGFYVAFPFGLAGSSGFTPIHTLLLGAGPARRFLVAWPAAGLCWFAGVVAVAADARPKVSAALFGLAAFAVLRFAVRLSLRADYVAVPVGTIALGGVAAYLYGR